MLRAPDTSEIEAALIKKIKGQPEAVKWWAKKINYLLSGAPKLSNGPRIVGFSAGPSGVGKTELVKVVFDYLANIPVYDKKSNLWIKNPANKNKRPLKIDCGKLRDQNAAGQLFGAEPSYKNAEKGGLMSFDKIESATIDLPDGRRVPIVILDEMEKMPPDAFVAFMDVLDQGSTKDGLGREIDFYEAVVMATSNIGNTDIQALKAEGGRELSADDELQMRKTALKTDERFPPEMLGRLGGDDNILWFNRLTPSVVMDIVYSTIKDLEIVLEQKGLRSKLFVTDTFLSHFAENFNSDTGTRPIQRKIEELLPTIYSVEKPFHSILLDINVTGEMFCVGVHDNAFHDSLYHIDTDRQQQAAGSLDFLNIAKPLDSAESPQEIKERLSGEIARDIRAREVGIQQAILEEQVKAEVEDGIRREVLNELEARRPQLEQEVCEKVHRQIYDLEYSTWHEEFFNKELKEQKTVLIEDLRKKAQQEAQVQFAQEQLQLYQSMISQGIEELRNVYLQNNTSNAQTAAERIFNSTIKPKLDAEITKQQEELFQVALNNPSPENLEKISDQMLFQYVQSISKKLLAEFVDRFGTESRKYKKLEEEVLKSGFISLDDIGDYEERSEVAKIYNYDQVLSLLNEIIIYKIRNDTRMSKSERDANERRWLSDSESFKSRYYLKDSFIDHVRKYLDWRA